MDIDDECRDNSPLPFNIWFFGFMWVLLHIVVGAIFDYYRLYLDSLISIPLPLSMPSEQRWQVLSIIYFFKDIIFIIIEGVAIGGIEWGFLNRYFVWSKWWIVVTIIGVALSSFWYSFTQNFMSPATMITIFFLRETVKGAAFGSFQWIVLRKEVYWAYLWIVVSILGGFVGAFIVIQVNLDGIIELIPVSYNVIIMISQALKRFAGETIKVVCLIMLLYYSLKRDQVGMEVAHST